MDQNERTDMGNRIGQATGTVYTSPARAKRQAKRREAEDRRWAAKAGPVTVRKIGDPPVSDTPTDVPAQGQPSA